MFQLVRILVLNHGHMIYTLDDPYIHLSLAEEIARGHYGLNEGEFTAPSSSILWPFLLIPFAHGPLHEWMPFFINIFSTLLIVALSTLMINQLFKEPENFAGLILKITLVLLISLALQTYSLFWTGMEHLLQAFISLLAAYGLIRFVQTDNIPWYLILAIVVGPLLRYEMVFVSFAALGVLFLSQKKMAAITIGIITSLPLILFSLFLYVNDHILLPNSVFIKTDFKHTIIDYVLKNIQNNPFHMKTRIANLLPTVLCLGLLSAALLTKRKIKKELLLAIAGLGVLLTRIAISGLETGISSVARYIVYSIAFCLPLVLFLYRDTIQNWSKTKTSVTFLGIALLTPMVFYTHFLMAVRAPASSNTIYLQQFQMKRFLEHYAKPVAINDLGLSSYKNPNKVVDLVGLGYKEAYDLRIADIPNWMNVLVEKNGIELIIIYEHWFAYDLIDPETSKWEKIATLHMNLPDYVLGGTIVTFYTTTSQAKKEVLPILYWLQTDLPPGASLEIYPEPQT